MAGRNRIISRKKKKGEGRKGKRIPEEARESLRTSLEGYEKDVALYLPSLFSWEKGQAIVGKANEKEMLDRSNSKLPQCFQQWGTLYHESGATEKKKKKKGRGVGGERKIPVGGLGETASRMAAGGLKLATSQVLGQTRKTRGWWGSPLERPQGRLPKETKRINEIGRREGNYFLEHNVIQSRC